MFFKRGLNELRKDPVIASKHETVIDISPGTAYKVLEVQFFARIDQKGYLWVKIDTDKQIGWVPGTSFNLFGDCGYYYIDSLLNTN
jgi:hypothetical protein